MSTTTRTAPTPGPWRLYPHAAPTTVFGAPVGDDTPIVASRLRPEDVALIAAAPELRDTLRRLVNLANHPMFTNPHDVPAFATTIAYARTLLARIDGGPR